MIWPSKMRTRNQKFHHKLFTYSIFSLPIIRLSIDEWCTLKLKWTSHNQESCPSSLNWLMSDIVSIIYMIQVNKHSAKQPHLRYFAVRNEQLVTSCSVLWLCFVLISVDVEKCHSRRSVLPAHISNHEIWLRWCRFGYLWA